MIVKEIYKQNFLVFVYPKILGLALLMITIFPAFAQTAEVPFLTVKTDDNHYDEGDTIVISGQVKTIIIDTPIILQIWYEGNMIDVAQFFPAQDGSYSQFIIAEKPLWRNEGEYLIRVSYGEANIAESTIDFTPKKEFMETKDSFEVEIPNGGTFDAEYSILGGSITNMILEPDNFTLKLILETPDEGTISIKLPREAIDAEKPNGDMEDFIVLIDGIQVNYVETEVTAESRLITINFEEGASEIEIIGTRVIPEFGTVAIMILIIGFIVTIGLSKNHFQLKI